MSDANPTDEGLLKRLWSAIDPKGTLSARIMLRIYRILRWAAFLVFISFISTTGWLIYTRSEARDQVETLRLENAADEAQRKSDIAAMNSTIAAHQQHQVDLRKSNVELLQANHTLKGALRRKIAVQPPRPANPRLKADLKQSLERNMILQKRLEKKLSAAPRAADNARLRAEAEASRRQADAAHREVELVTRKHTALIREHGACGPTLLEVQVLRKDERLEFEAFKAREGVPHWNQLTPVRICFFCCVARDGDEIRLIRRGKRGNAKLRIKLSLGEGSRRGLYIRSQVDYVPSGIYDIETLKKGKQHNLSVVPRYISCNPRQIGVRCPDGSIVWIPPQPDNSNLIVLIPEGHAIVFRPRIQ